MGIDVTAPDGRAWTVRRRLRWPRWRRPGLRDVDWVAVPVLDGDDLAGVLVGLGVLLLVGVLFAVVILVFLPLVVFLAEAVAVLVAATVLGRRWFVVASTLGPPAEERRWQVRGFLASRRAVREVADELRSGVEAAPADAVE
jgi:hypothetical protein